MTLKPHYIDKFFKRIIAFVIIILSHHHIVTLKCAAQTTYPVQVNAHLLPPYSLYLSDYYSGTREKLTVTIINRDQLQPTLNVKLRMTITAQNGIRLQTNPNVHIEPIVVESGSPVRLTLDDLAPYFQPTNLIGSITGGKLPEGNVEFCFQAFEAFTSRPLSLPSCTRAWITSHKPPLLSLPLNDENIAFRDPVNLMFQWTPRHHGLTYVEYEFILKEIWDNGMAPQAAFAYAPEIYRETVRGTSVIYGALHPPLLPGKRYAWAVRAQAREGVEAVNLFQNDGLSEIRWFTLQDDCVPVQFVMATAEKKRLNIEWTPQPEHIGFTISYRLIDRSTPEPKAGEWFEQETKDPRSTLYGLKNGGTYEYRVGSFCGLGQPVYSPIFSTTLPETDSARLAQCGIMPAVNLSNHELIKELQTGDVIMANDYPVTITRITGANGIFTGEGWTIMPWLNDAKIAVQFTSIKVNTDKQMIGGYIDAKYDQQEGQIANLDDLTEGGFDVGNVKTGITKIDHVLNFTIPGVDAFSLNEEGELVIEDGEGQSHIIPGSKEGLDNEGNKIKVFPMTVQDKNGDVYQIEKITDESGNETVKATHIGRKTEPLAADSFDPTQLDGTIALVRFDKGSGKYAFDTWKDYYSKVVLIRSKYQKLFDDYYASWKMLPEGGKDEISATIQITDSTIDPNKVIFTTPQGTKFNSKYDSKTNSYTIQLVAGPAGDAQEVYALYAKQDGKYFNFGKLSIATYKPQTHNVILVSVDGAPVAPDVEQKLEDIYGQVGVTWNVTRDAFSYSGADKLMEKSTGLSTYNEAMRALNDQYESERGSAFDKTANYIFFLKATGAERTNSRDVAAFMPRGAQIGYIFTSEIQDKNEATATAHELGHGRFQLYHTFDTHYGGYEKGQTTNLMDYTDHTHLAKWQWDVIHDPAIIEGWFDSDEKSAMKSLLTSKYVFTHNQLSTRAYASKKGTDEFTQEAIDHVDSLLYQLDTAGVSTYIYFAYIWFHSGNLASFDKLLENSFKHAYDSISTNLGVKDFNLLAIVNAKYDTALAAGLKSVSFRERFYPKSGLSQDCVKEVNNYLKSGYKKTFVDGLDAALKERAELLSRSLRKCEIKKTELVLTTDVNTAAEQAVQDVLTFKTQDDAACNLCVRAAILHLKKDPVLFPASGSYLFFTYDKETDPVIRGKISGNGSAATIVSDFNNLSSSELNDYFVQENKLSDESMQDFWKRLQTMADEGNIIVGTYPGHVFMLVPGGLIDVVNNFHHTNGKTIVEPHKSNPKIEDGDKYGFCFTPKRGITSVPRILECGVNVKSSNAPIYANMDFTGATTKVKWFRYIK
jgi:hypothetical protein